MAPASNEEQFKFLISCIRYSNNGKVDFEEVAKECDIVSKGAAAKRYERMMKFHGIHQSQTSTAEANRATPAPSRPKASPSAAANKKRKAAGSTEIDPNEDDDEGLPNVKAEGSGIKVKAEKGNKKVKTEIVKDKPKGKGVASGGIKEEGETKDGVPIAFDDKATVTIPQLDGIDETSLYNDFLAFGAMANENNSAQADICEGLSQAQSAALDMITTSNGTPSVQDSVVIAD